ncbi:SDR family oxidoreductase [Steroidobacter sp. S1-65]|uniref:SDR family oxidoreductase n=1 Tax=Steroidobacter gossypii TaxID=2805490 RepID=A0ABS1WQW9_9GAMM|nr:SDR family oxidoreductase [Steroidobacter gossypii]MBM0103362.1 SDR family oxidoreductase [Steroidobacter gossypii]
MSAGNVCIITGSATGIGAACAVELARRGWRTVINFTKSEAEAQQTARECEKHGGETLLIRADVSQDADCRRMADATLQKWGRIDGLINNAGITKVAFNHADLNALSAEDFQKVYSVNVVGAFQMIRAVEPSMRQQGHGSIVNVSSRAGIDSIGTSIAYAASKGALNTMTMGLARALGPEIRVNAVCPGFVETRWLQQAIGDKYDKARTRFASNSALQKTSTPEDIADVAVWLLTGAPTVTGELILVDGGNRLGAPPR